MPFDMGTPMGLMELGGLERGLSELLTAPVDLIPFAALRPDRREEVLAEAVPLWPGLQSRPCRMRGPDLELMLRYTQGDLAGQLVNDAVWLHQSASRRSASMGSTIRSTT